MACVRIGLVGLLVLWQAATGAAQDLTPHAVGTPDAFECSDAAAVIAGEPPGEARPLMRRLFALDRCAAILAAEQGATPTDVPPDRACVVGAAGGDWAIRSYVYRRTCSEGATERVWGTVGERTPSGTGMAATLTPEGTAPGR